MHLIRQHVGFVAAGNDAYWLGLAYLYSQLFPQLAQKCLAGCLPWLDVSAKNVPNPREAISRRRTLAQQDTFAIEEDAACVAPHIPFWHDMV